MKVENLRTLMTEELRDIYDAEKQITRALPKMIKSVESQGLKDALSGHLDETKHQVERLEQAFELLDIKPRSKSCPGMKGVLEEGQEMLTMTEGDHVRDIAIISAAQRVEHYEMAAYGNVRAYAEALGENEVAELLTETLEEEKQADQRLTEIGITLLSEVESRSVAS